MPEQTETYTEYGVFVWHGSAQVLHRTFRKPESVGIWRTTLTNAEQDRIAGIRRRQVTVTRGDWMSADG